MDQCGPAEYIATVLEEYLTRTGTVAHSRDIPPQLPQPPADSPDSTFGDRVVRPLAKFSFRELKNHVHPLTGSVLSDVPSTTEEFLAVLKPLVAL